MHTVQLLGVSSNSFGDQIIRVLVNGIEQTFVNGEGSWISPQALLKQLEKGN